MAYIKAKGRIIFGQGAAKPFEISDLGSDINNYWNTDYGLDQSVIGSKVGQWTSQLGYSESLTQGNTSYQLRYSTFNRRNDRKALQPYWTTAYNYLSGTITALPPPWTIYFVISGPSNNGTKDVFNSSGNGTYFHLGVNYVAFNSPGGSSQGMDSSADGGQIAFPLDNIGWHVVCWTYDGYDSQLFYLDNPKSPWVMRHGGGNTAITKVAFFNETGGACWWDQIGDVLYCKSSHNETTRTNVMNLLRDRYFPIATTATANWTPTALGESLTAWYEVSNDNVIMSSYAIEDGDMSYPDTSKWSKYNCTAEKISAAPPLGNTSGKIIRVTNTGNYGGINSIIATTAGCYYRIYGWVRKIAGGYSPWIDWANNTSVWSGTADLNVWKRFDFISKRPVGSAAGPTFRGGYYSGEITDWADIHVDSLHTSRLKDLSGRDNHLLAAADSSAPIFMPSVTGRGKSGVRFDGINDLMTRAFTLSSTGTAHLFMAFKHLGTGPNTNKTVFDGNTVNSMRLYLNGSTLYTFGSGNNGPSIAYTANGWTVVDVVLKPGVSNQTKIGLKGGTQTTGSITTTLNGLTIGASPTGADPSGMIFYGGFVADRELTVEERANAAAYYKDRLAEYYY